jgi:hypothetical protein
MPKHKHTHQYKRTKVGKKGYEVYKCTIAGCPHFVDPGILEGRMNVCHQCGEEHVIDKVAALLAKPKCRVCMALAKEESKPDSARVSDQAVSELVNSLLSSSSAHMKYNESEDE